MSAPAAPAAARAVFGERMEAAIRFADLLAGAGVERGLIGPREPARIWSRHLLNCAVLADHVPPGARVLDIGSGAGLPGIPLALARPDLAVTLLEPMLRRVRFLDEVVAELGLPVTVVRGRAEHAPARSTDVVVARAVAPLAALIPLALPLLVPGGRLLALKGHSVEAELDEAGPVMEKWPGAAMSYSTATVCGDDTVIVQVDLGHRRGAS